MIVARAALVLLVTAGPALASASARTTTSELRRDRAAAASGSDGGQTVAAPPTDPKAQAQFEFMMARRMESAGDNAGALASLERARKLDPEAAEIPAEIAGYHYRQNRPTEAVAAAEQALKLDKNNVEAHNILGTVFSAWAEGATPPPPAARRHRRATPRSNISARFRTRR